MESPRLGRPRFGMWDFIEVHDWELESVGSFLDLLYSNIPTREGCDRVIWKLKKSNEFIVRFYREALRGAPNNSYPWKTIWCVKAPKRLSFFVWTTACEKILTCDNLIKQGFNYVKWLVCSGIVERQ